MSQVPKDLESKYNHNDKFRWVDAQLEKFMERQKRDAEYIENLEGGVSGMEKRILELEMENAELKDKLVNYGHTPTDGLEVGNPEDYEISNQLELFPDWEFTKSGM